VFNVQSVLQGCNKPEDVNASSSYPTHCFAAGAYSGYRLWRRRQFAYRPDGYLYWTANVDTDCHDPHTHRHRD
jgi:hypothetical protein